MVRYLDDFVVCFQYRADALRFQGVLRKRLARFSLMLEPSKTKLVEFGRFAAKHAPKRERRRPETIYFVGFTLCCSRNQQGGYNVGIRAERSRVHRVLSKLRDLMRRMRHLPVRLDNSRTTSIRRAAQQDLPTKSVGFRAARDAFLKGPLQARTRAEKQLVGGAYSGRIPRVSRTASI